MSIYGKPLLTGAEAETDSGSIVSMSDALAAPLRSLLVDIEPVQDLHGYGNPWPAGGGKNLLPMTVDGIKSENNAGTWDGNMYTRYGVTYTLKTNASGAVVGIMVSGTAENNTVLRLYSDGISGREFVVGTEYSITSGFTGTTTNAASTRFVVSDNITNTKVADTTFTWSEAFGQNVVRFDLSLFTGVTVNGEFKPMIRLASVSDATFAPYSNICPISGWSAVNVWRTGRNLFPDAGDITVVAKKSFKYNSPIIFKGQTVTLSFSDITYSGGFTSSVVFCIRANNVGITNLYFNTSTKSKTWTATEDVYGLNFYATSSSATNPGVTTVYHDAQLELGSTATPYEPYSGNQYTIQLGQTVYGGTLDVTNGVLTVDRAYAVFDGSSDETWAYYAVAQGNMFRLQNYSAMKTTAGIIPAISDAFKTVLQSDRTNGTISSGAGTKNIDFIFDGANSLAEWREWLAENNVQLCYELATPITIPLTPQEISTLQGQNNVRADSGDSTMEYLKRSLTYIS